LEIFATNWTVVCKNSRKLCCRAIGFPRLS